MAAKSSSQARVSKGAETITVEKFEVICDGGGGPLGHPRVFLHIDRQIGSITCGYCSRHYVLDPHASSAH